MGARKMFVTQEETAHEFDALNTLLLVVILGLCVLASYLIKKYKCYYIPESAATLLVGLVVGAAARILDPSKAELDVLSFNVSSPFSLCLWQIASKQRPHPPARVLLSSRKCSFSCFFHPLSLKPGTLCAPSRYRLREWYIDRVLLT